LLITLKVNAFFNHRIQVSYVFDDNLNSIIGTSFVEGYKLKVKAKDFEKAKTIFSLSKL